MSRKAAWAKSVLLLKTPRANALALAAVVATAAAVVLIAERRPSPDTATADAQPQASIVTPHEARSAATADATPPARSSNRRTVVRSTSSAPTVGTSNVSESDSTSADVAAGSETTRLASSGTASADVQAITITGCLERADDAFRLKDTEGEDAPRARSWKAGFLKRSNRAVDVVDSMNRFRLANHVGQRVSATGTLVDGDMQLRSLRRVSTSCDKDA